MTGEEHPPTATPAARSLPLPVLLTPGTDWRAEWCAACKAWSRLTGSILLLTPDGVATVGAWAWCEFCDDPADEEGRARG
ncbi:hypothetical protein ACFRQM_09275 [Streptomyces sp. NPDC056831]|uniref:hypothetical protein n=1 Tax=Streptomyces sp. NPDC056831 TaxID=3345954 RepID=UPI0036C0B952